MDLNNSENGRKDARLLPSYGDEHGGVIVELEEPMNPDDFALILRCSLLQWKLQVIIHSWCQYATLVFLYARKSAKWRLITVLPYNLIEILISLFSTFFGSVK